MGVKLVLLAAGAAIISLVTYRRAQAADAGRLDENMRELRQATSVVLAIGNAVWAVFDALQLLFRPSRMSRQIGIRAADVDD